MLHISTTETFFLDAIPLAEDRCMICRQEAEQEAGWIGIRCKKCGEVWDEETWGGDIAKRRRELMGLTRREMAEKTGLSPHTIKKYEWTRCSKKYYDLTTKMIEIHFSNE